VILANAWIVTMDDAGTEHERGWLRIENGLVAEVAAGDPPQRARRGAGSAAERSEPASAPTSPPRVGSAPPATRQDRRPDEVSAARGPLQRERDVLFDLGGAVITPGLVNTHHHLYQTLTRAQAQQADLFTWLRTLYPTWARIDAEMEYAAARAGLAELALSGCSTVFDHHYVFPRGVTGLVEAEVQAARELGVRIVASRGSMDLGQSEGGLPPDELAEELDDVLADTERLLALADGDRVQVAVAPCSPFSVTTRLMEESAALARRHGLRLHTHLAETVEEEEYCRELYGCTPVEYLERVGWLASDVWCAHCVHVADADLQRFGAAGVGVAHCPTSNLRLGAGIASVGAMLAAGVRVGLGVDGSASNERGDLFLEVKQALLVARARGGPEAMSARDALRIGTRSGAAVLGRDDIGSLEPGRRADVAVWRTDGLELGGAADPVAGLVFSAPHRVDRLYVGGEEVVCDGRLVTADEEEIAREHRIQAARLAR
jgi:cytosine/adenosine deaminase-related metal-dependent hydrolase